MAQSRNPEIGAAFRHARVQLGWSQELFAEKAIVSDGTIRAAENGNRLYPSTHKALLDAINKGRAACIPPMDPLTIPYGVEEAPEVPESTEKVPVPEPPKPDGDPDTAIATVDPALVGIDGVPVAPTAIDRPPEKGRGEPPRIAWDDESPLVTICGHAWRIKDACEGVVIFGATGSGKTSGSGQTFARSYLQASFGGLVLCAKPEEANLWKRYAFETGREPDLILFGRDPSWSFNFLEHESRRQGLGPSLTENLVNLFTEIASIGAGASSGSAPDPFWERAMKSLVRNCVELLVIARAPVTLHAIFDIVRSAPTTPEMVQSEEWRQASACWRQIQTAQKASVGSSSNVDTREVAAYWLDHFPTLGDRTRGSIVAMFITLAEALTRSKMRELFCSRTTLAPDDILDGRIVVIDLSYKEWGEVGRIAAVLWKYCLQKTVERRKDNAAGKGRPVFIWADECQYFVSRHDALFQATARSARASSVYLTQSIPSLVAGVGAEQEGRALVDSLLGSLGTKIFHANSDAMTNEFASKLIGKQLQLFRNESRSVAYSTKTFFPDVTNSHGVSEQLGDIIRPDQFAMLAKGGPENKYQVGAVVFQTGRAWGINRYPYAFCTFDQRLGVKDAPPPPSPAPKALRPSSNIAHLLFPWIGQGKSDWKRWCRAAVLWLLFGPFVVSLAFVAFFRLRELASPNAEAIQPQADHLFTTSQPAHLARIPVNVEFVSSLTGKHGKAIFSTTARDILPITVKVTSRPSGNVRLYHLRVSAVMSASIVGSVDGDLEDGDELEVSNPNFEPIKVTFHHT